MAKPDVCIIPQFLTVGGRIIFFVFISARITLCMAGESVQEFYLERDPAYAKQHRLLDLEAAGRPKVMIAKNQSGALVVDASAVFSVNPDAFIDSSLDFDRYAEFKAPHVVQSKVIASGDENTPMIIWNKMRYGVVSSSQYQAVITYKDHLVSGFAGSRWRLHHPENTPPNFPDSTIFNEFGGFWYIEPLETNSGGEHRQTKVYVRYYLKIKYRWWVPSFIINYFSIETGALERDVVNFLMIFKKLSAID